MIILVRDVYAHDLSSAGLWKGRDGIMRQSDDIWDDV